MAPTYANIFMDKFQRKPIFDYFIETGLSPLIWFRFMTFFSHGHPTKNLSMILPKLHKTFQKNLT